MQDIKKDPLVSIIIPVYNTEKSVGRLLRVLLSDKYKNIEIICIDDASTDKSLAVLKDFMQIDKRVKVAHQKENKGPSAARNLGIKKAKGEYIIFIDSDDFVSKKFLTKMVKSITQPGVALTVSGFRQHLLKKGKTIDKFVDPPQNRRRGEPQRTYILRLMIVDGRMYSVANKIFRAEIIKNNNIFFDEEIRFAEDTKFVLEYCKQTDGVIDFILEPLYFYNYGTETSVIKNSSLKWANWQKSFEDLKEWVGPNPSKKEQYLLGVIKMRWHISHIRANQRFQHKKLTMNVLRNS